MQKPYSTVIVYCSDETVVEVVLPDAVIFAVPPATPFTSPVLLTVATVLLSEVHEA